MLKHNACPWSESERTISTIFLLLSSSASFFLCLFILFLGNPLTIIKLMFLAFALLNKELSLVIYSLYTDTCIYTICYIYNYISYINVYIIYIYSYTFVYIYHLYIRYMLFCMYNIIRSYHVVMFPLITVKS